MSRRTKVDWGEQIPQLLEKNLKNLAKKVLAGQPLTAGELKTLQAGAGGRPQAGAGELNFAANQSGLADALGVSRQRIAYHCKQLGNPGRREDGRYCVADWRRYLKSVGRAEVPGGGETPEAFRPRVKPDFGDGVESAVYHIGEALPDMLPRVLAEFGIEATEDQANQVAVFLYLTCRCVGDRMLKRWGFPSTWEPAAQEDGTPDANYPPAIMKAAEAVPTK